MRTAPRDAARLPTPPEHDLTRANPSTSESFASEPPPASPAQPANSTSPSSRQQGDERATAHSPTHADDRLRSEVQENRSLAEHIRDRWENETEEVREHYRRLEEEEAAAAARQNR
ncbi:hypothetical protein JCM3766R1_001815 [Sporobolomyces carnicolor]